MQTRGVYDKDLTDKRLPVAKSQVWGNKGLIRISIPS